MKWPVIANYPCRAVIRCSKLFPIKTMRHTVTIFLIACVLNPFVMSANSQAQCSATRLSTKEAEGLLRVIPEALEAEHLGGRVPVVMWSPGVSYRTDEFYFYQLVSTKSLATTPLDNGMIGYFGVSKITGQVVELNSDQRSVEGTELSRAQRTIRAKHCVSRDLVAQHQDVSLER